MSGSTPLRSDLQELPRLSALPGTEQALPAWDPFPIALRDCPCCGGRGAAVLVRPDGLPVAQCSGCRCFYVALMLTDELLDRYYRGYWGNAKTRLLTEELARYLVSSAPARAAADHTLRKIGTLAGGWPGKRVLDVGCGFGEKTSMMRALGAAVRGIDVAADAVAFVSRHLGVDASRTTLERDPGPPAACDVVTMFEFVEHPLHPLATIEEAVRRLRPGGLLAFVTPNGTAGERRLGSRESWEGFRAEMEHLQYFHVETVAFIARRFGCRILHLEQYGVRAPEDETAAASNALRGRFSRLRLLAKFVPGVRAAVYALRAAQGRRRAAILPHREDGDYHLFAVLQVP